MIESDFDEPFEDPDDAGPWLRPEIPERLYSAYDNKPFEKCVECSADLLASSVPYGIQKVYRGGETIFEFAVCMPCMESFNGEWSEESRKAVEEYLATATLRHLEFEGCNLCGTDADDAECVVFALASGNGLLDVPHLVCNACAEGLEDLLSEATRKGMEDFTSRNFPGVPEQLDVPSVPLVF